MLRVRVKVDEFWVPLSPVSQLLGRIQFDLSLFLFYFFLFSLLDLKDFSIEICLLFPLLLSHIVNPLISLAISPNPFFDLQLVFVTIFSDIKASTTLLAFQPAAMICPSVFEEVEACSVLSIFRMITFVEPTIGPPETALAMHLVILPLTKIDLFILPGEEAMAV